MNNHKEIAPNAVWLLSGNFMRFSLRKQIQFALDWDKLNHVPHFRHWNPGEPNWAWKKTPVYQVDWNMHICSQDFVLMETCDLLNLFLARFTRVWNEGMAKTRRKVKTRQYCIICFDLRTVYLWGKCFEGKCYKNVRVFGTSWHILWFYKTCLRW